MESSKREVWMKPSEQRLILLLLVLVGIFATAFTSMRMLAWQRTLDKKDRSVAMRQAEVEQMLGEKDVWQQKLDFLRQKQPPMKNVNAANKELYQFVSESAQKHNLEINNRQTVQPAEGTYFHQVGETLVIKAEVKPLMQWMHELLSPDSFYYISSLSLQPLPEDNSKVLAQVHVTRLYSPAEASPPENTVDATPSSTR
jgi:hypothetical protein